MGDISFRVLIYEALRAVACLGICTLGIAAMYFSGGETGVGWAILGIVFVYFPSIIWPEFEDGDDLDDGHP